MKLQKFINALQNLGRAYPELLECEVFTSIDQEGNGYNWLPEDFFAPAFAKLQDHTGATGTYQGMKIIDGDIVGRRGLKEMENEGTDISDYEQIVVLHA